ncbi:MAG: biotin--[acetyl-CoA-carboxylase] ligase [Verrucomicrobiae bacterium]|nr:biotin--[acetyl-CoA-carboxylase] ligase [Verrucomicrobiae bacterium]
MTSSLLNSEEALLRALIAAGAQPVAPLDLAVRAALDFEALASRLDALEDLGFELERHPAFGIRLVGFPERLIPEEIGARLPRERTVGRSILIFTETTSTHDVAARLAAQGAKEGSVILAETQTAGRGRRGRVWASPAGKGVWFTVILRPHLPPSAASRITVMAGVAVARALRRTTGLPLHIKWPNDLLCRGRKLAGILTEIGLEEGRLAYALLGVGVNVNLVADDLPEDLRGCATSLKQEAGRAFSRATLAAEMLGEIEQGLVRLDDTGFPAVADEWIALDDTLGRQVSVAGPDGRRRGLAAGLDTDGALLLRLDEGRTERIHGGDVEVEKIRE